MLIRCLVLGWCCGLVVGCSSEREQALALVDHVEAIDISLTPRERMPQIGALAALQLRDTELNQVKELCLGAHRALIDAETEQAKARYSLDHAEQTDDVTKRLAQAQSVAASIERSTLKLQQAQTTFPECERQAREIALRFPKRSP